ncbi:discoidin domain-containing protein [Pseudomonadota bacterium]
MMKDARPSTFAKHSKQVCGKRLMVQQLKTSFSRVLIKMSVVYLVLLAAIMSPPLAKAAPGDLALNKAATASSSVGGFVPQNAVDGDGTTRWSSDYPLTDPLFTETQWISLDLGAVYPIDRVVLNWAGGYASVYEIQVSLDGSNWNPAFSETAGNGGLDDNTFLTPADARYVRMYGTTRGTQWGYALIDFEVYAVTAPPVLTSVSVTPTAATVAIGNIQPFTAMGLDQFGAEFTTTTLEWAVEPGGGTIDPSSGLFTATTMGGPFTVTATADGTVSGTAEVTVVDTLPVPSGDLALNKAATASSSVGGFVPQNAVDGDGTTRWSSDYPLTDPLFTETQWISLDLGAVYPIDRVVLNWAGGYASVYEIQVSLDGSNWNPAFSETAGNGGLDDNTFLTPADARYVRMYGTTRGTQWGYALIDFEVYAVTTTGNSPVATGGCGTTRQGQALIGTLQATDPETPSLLMYSLADGSTGPYTTTYGGEVTITDPTTGAFTYTPASLASGGDRGTDTFTFRVADPDGNFDIGTETVIVDLTIMPLGDSTTAGTESGPVPPVETKVAYRKALYDRLVADGFSFDFVGTQTFGFGVPDFDFNNQGQQGWTALEIAWGRDGGYPTDGVRAWLDANPTDIILLHIGTNDLAQGQSAAATIPDVETILNEIDLWEITNDKYVTVLLAQIIDQDPLEPEVLVFNSSLLTMADNRIANGDDIIVVNQHDVLIYPDDMADDLHPNAGGYTKMANPWFNELTNLVDKCP